MIQKMRCIVIYNDSAHKLFHQFIAVGVFHIPVFYVDHFWNNVFLATTLLNNQGTWMSVLVIILSQILPFPSPSSFQPLSKSLIWGRHLSCIACVLMKVHNICAIILMKPFPDSISSLNFTLDICIFFW